MYPLLAVSCGTNHPLSFHLPSAVSFMYGPKFHLVSSSPSSSPHPQFLPSVTTSIKQPRDGVCLASAWSTQPGTLVHSPSLSHQTLHQQQGPDACLITTPTPPYAPATPFGPSMGRPGSASLHLKDQPGLRIIQAPVSLSPEPGSSANFLLVSEFHARARQSHPTHLFWEFVCSRCRRG
jgi:hypothetical protein